MKIQKIRDVKTPSRGTSHSAGIDFHIPNDWNAGRSYMLRANETITIPSGIIADIPTGFMLCGFSKSGVALKQNIGLAAGVIDEDYTGEISLTIVNMSNSHQFIKPGQKILQYVLVPVFYDNIEVVDLVDKETDRGQGGFGSTGIN